MVNKLWYEDIDKDVLLISRNYLQSYIDIYCFDSEQFRVVEDIVTENVGEFLEIILKNYQQYHFHLWNLSDIGQALELYFHRAYIDEFNTCYPDYPENDRRSLGLYVIYYIQIGPGYTILPEDVPYLIAYLHTDADEIVGSDKKIDAYLDQFDHIKRCNEGDKRWNAITKERQEAIKEGKPLPIRPMSIKLSSCWKKP
ncbi:hypothetical protein [Candidatus Tisiphia endosymbiont of Ptychoptera albimana]|uniref:hypothetical protein n=1 Tax=Candidatus Tisiphia endosymbiont of Ptychoptera albimana TaxID=3066260 RepID=UPI00312C762C